MKSKTRLRPRSPTTDRPLLPRHDGGYDVAARFHSPPWAISVSAADVARGCYRFGVHFVGRQIDRASLVWHGDLLRWCRFGVDPWNLLSAAAGIVGGEGYETLVQITNAKKCKSSNNVALAAARLPVFARYNV